MDDDRLAGKRTLPVRFGKKAGEGLMLVVVLLMPVMAYLAFGFNLPMLVIVPGLCLFVAVTKAKGVTFNKLLMSAGLINVLYVLLVVVRL